MKSIVPESPGSKTITERQINPADLDPDLAAMQMAQDLMKGHDAPSDITKPFAVRKAIYTALNHDAENPTGYDASLRLHLYQSYERSSLNVEAKLFNSFMAFLMKPRMIIQGMPTSPQQQQEPGFLSRFLTRMRGQQPQTQQGTQS